MSAPRGDDLERRLTELFQQRASTVSQARPVDLDSGESDRKAAGPRPERVRRFRENLGLLAAAAVVFVAIAGTVLGIQAGLSGQGKDESGIAKGNSNGIAGPGGVPTRPSCTVSAPASWLRAIEAGAVPVDRAFNMVASVNGATGDYLAIQGNEPTSQTSALYSDIEVALFRGSKGVTIYTPEGSDFPHADPTGAITADWVTFALARPQNLAYSYKVMLHDRGAGITRTLADETELQGKSVLGAPVIAAGKVYWLSTVHNKPEVTRLESWDLVRNSAAGSVPAAGATGLVSYGRGVALIRQGASEATLSNGAGAPLMSPRFPLGKLAGSNFGFDGREKLSYLQQMGGSIVFHTFTVGRDHLKSVETHLKSTSYSMDGFADAAISPLIAIEANSGYSLLEMRSGVAIRLPEGVSLQAVVGDEAIFGTGTTKSGAAGLSRVALSALPPVDC